MKIEEMIKANRADCSGCEACANICPRNAIEMIRDAEGFAYPKINPDLCIKCGRCDATCPALNYTKNFPDALSKVFAAINPDEKIRRHSSSGGAFTTLSEIILRASGVIFGAAFDKNWHVVHTSARTLEELESLRGSKYTQSQIRKTYRQVKKALRAGKKVLFSGTPCQCAGLKHFLGKDYKNLLTVDIICHGTPPPALWEKYIDEIGSSHEITRVNFRSKRRGWQVSHLEITFADQGHYIKPVNEDFYGKIFLIGLGERPACHACKFKFPSVQSDLTLADAWGVQNFAPEFFDNRGTSLVIVHTAKGQEIFEQTNLIKRQVKFADVAWNNPRFITPSVADERREQFFGLLNRYDYLAVMQKYCAEEDAGVRKRQHEKDQRNLHASFQEIMGHYRQKFKRNVLILTHSWEGGAKVFLEHYAQKHFQDCGVYILQRIGAGQLACTESLSSMRLTLKEDPAALSNLAKTFNITEVFVNHLIHFNLPMICNWLVSCGRPFKFFVHDFLCVCAEYQLTCQTRFCNANETNAYCRRKFSERGYPDVKLGEWRNFFGQLLSRADKVIVPTTFVANILKRFYPPLTIEVEPHYLTQPLKKTFRPEFAARGKLRVTFLGNMFDVKGEEYLLLLNEFIRQENLPLEFVVLGEYMGRMTVGTKDGIIFAGKYDYRRVSELLAHFETAFVAVLSIVPETYCYTASEAILSGYPVLTSNIGAQAFRVQKNSCGWVMNMTSEDRGLNALKNFLRAICTPDGRKEILRRAAQTANFVNGME